MTAHVEGELPEPLAGVWFGPIVMMATRPPKTGTQRKAEHDERRRKQLVQQRGNIKRFRVEWMLAHGLFGDPESEAAKRASADPEQVGSVVVDLANAQIVQLIRNR